jgi:1-acyl-sn-glycerol-3-phosphate acyltransferase
MSKILGYPLAFVRFILIFLLMIVFLICYSISLLFSKHTDKRAFRLRRNYLKLTLIILNVSVELKGGSDVTPALYVCNHRTFFDPAVLCIFIDAFVIAKAEIANYPVINKGAERTGVIWVKRESHISRKKTRQALIDNLVDGRNILVYPEGTTNNEKKVLPFKKGTFHEIAKINVPAVPCVVEYSHRKDFWKGGEDWINTTLDKMHKGWSTAFTT